MKDSNRDLLLAILAMDSYNQGYDKGLNHDKTNIGGASLKGPADGVPRDMLNAWQSAGFYVAAYELPGETVISFRGTDRAIDVLTGWPVGAGASFYGTQAPLALQFCEAVARKPYNAGPADKVTLTGHSLGGGLAGRTM